MAYQYVREPLRAEEADRLCHACQTTEEKLVLWTLLDTGLRVSELCGLTPQQLLWQQKALRISGKGGPYGKQSKKRVVPLSRRLQALLEPYFALHERWFVGPRQVQKIVKRVAERARISQQVTPHVLRHTFATMALQKGISLAAVQKILGHERLGTTAIYLNLTDLQVVDEYAQTW
jgi:integrase/recombinase XerD